MFGLKAFPQQLEQLQQGNPVLIEEVLAIMLPRHRERRIVYLRRRDRVAQTVSYARATLSGIWRKGQERANSPPMEYSREAIEAAERGIVFQENVWERMFNDLRIEPLRLWHEDVLADGPAAAKAVADYLGVAIQKTASVAVPKIEKQSDGEARDWAAQYSASR